MIRRIFSIRRRLFRFYCRYLNKKSKNQTYILNLISTKTIPQLMSLYKKYKSVAEFEHQIGRFIGMSLIAKELKAEENFTIVEFGTYKGVGLIALERAFARENYSNLTYVGIDTFNGLPESSTIWQKGYFSDTTFDQCHTNLIRNMGPKAEIKLIQSNFVDLSKNVTFSQLNDIRIFHFDADLGKSTKEALEITERYLKKAKPKSVLYFLFDDWGCHPEEVPDAFYEWLKNFNKSNTAHFTKVASTNLTRYYRVDLMA